MTWTRSLWVVAAALALAGCPTQTVRDNPLDPLNPDALPGSISGTVSFDATGTALADVPLSAVTITVDNASPVTADSTGAFIAGNLRPGAHRVVIAAPYCDPVQYDQVQVLPDQTSDVGAVALARGRARVAGTIKVFGARTDGGAGAVDHAGTRITVGDHPAGQPRSALTDSAGVFEIGDVAAGVRRLQIRRDGYAPAQLDVTLSPGERKELAEYTLGSAGFSATVSGTLLLEGYDPPGSEYTSARVTLSGGVASAAVDADGRFTITSPLGGTFDVVATKEGYEPAEARGVFLSEGAPATLPAVLTLRKARGAAKGEVAVSGGGNDGVRVCVQGDESACATSTIPSRTDGGTLGAFRIESVPSGQVVQLVATKDEGIRTYFGLSASRAVSPGPATDFGTIVLAYSGGDFRLRGRVLNPANNQLESNQDTTREPWVAVDLSAVNTAGFTYVSRSFDGTFTTWLPLGSAVAPDCADPANQTAATPLCVRVPAEGVQTLRLMLSDQPGAGGRTLGPIQGAILYDATPPSAVTLTLNGGAPWINASGGSTINPAVAAADAHSALRFLRLAAASAPATPDLAAAAAQGFTPTPSPLAIPDFPTEGMKQVAVRVYDAAGNSADAQAAIGLDRTPPAGVGVRIADANPQGYVRYSLVTVELDRGLAADVARVQISNSPSMAVPTDVGFVADATGRMNAPWALLAGSGQRTVYAVFTDPAGNASLPAQATVVVDPDPPTEPVLLLDENPCPPAPPSDARPNGFTNNARVCVTVLSDVDTDHLEVRGCTALRPPSVNQFDCDLSNTVDGDKTIGVVAVDRAGNVSGGAQVSVHLDRTPPPVPALRMLKSPGAAPEALTGGVKYVNSQIVVYELPTAPGELAEVRLEQTVPGSRQTEWFPWSPAGLYILASAADGTHTVQARLRDLAGNVSASLSAPDSVFLDQARPGTPLIAAGLPELTNGPASLTRTIGDPSIDAHFWRFEILGCGGGSCPPVPELANPLDYTLPLTANATQPDVIRIAARDLAGNLGPDLVALVTHDDKAPEAPQLAGNIPAIVNADLVTLPLTRRPRDPAVAPGGDHFTGLEYAVLAGSPPPACSAATAWIPSPSPASVFAPLTPDADHRICLRAVDGAGNSSAVSERVISEDSQPPGAPVVGVQSGTVNADGAFAWFMDPPPGDAANLRNQAGTLFDPGNHFSHFEVIGGPVASWTCLPLAYDPARRAWPPPAACAPHTARDFLELPLGQDQVNVFYLRGVDLAGNAGPPSAAVTLRERSTSDLDARSAGVVASPRIHGDRVVWVSRTTTSSSVQLFDLATQVPGTSDRPTAVRTGASGAAIRSVDVYGNQVAWEEQLTDLEIRSCQLGNCAIPSSNGHPGDDRNPRFHSGVIVYTSPVAREVRTFRPPATDALLQGTTDATEVSIFRDWVGWYHAPTSTGAVRRLTGATTSLGLIGSLPALAGMAAGTTDAMAVYLSAGGGFTSDVLRQREPFSGGVTQLSERSAPRRELDAWRSGTQLTVVSADSSLGPAGLMVLDSDEAFTPARRFTSVVVPGVQVFTPAAGPQRVVFGLVDEASTQTVALLDRSWQTRVEPSGPRQTSPRVAGSKVAWIDFRYSPAGDVVVLDRSTGRRRFLTDRMGSGFVRDSLAFDGQIAAWREVNSTTGLRRLWWLDTTLAAPSPAEAGTSCSTQSQACLPAVHAGRIVWSQGVPYDVWELDTTGGSGTPRNVTMTSTLNEVQPAVSPASAGSATPRYAWIEELGTIKYRDGAGAVQCALGCTGAQPVRDGLTSWADRFAWVEAGRIQVLDAGGVRPLVTDTTGAQSAPRLWQDLLVYLDSQNGTPAVHQYDFRTGTHLRALPRPAGIPQDAPHTDGQSVVFTDRAGGTDNVIWSLPK